MRAMLLSILVAPALLTAVLVTICAPFPGMGRSVTTVISASEAR